MEDESEPPWRLCIRRLEVPIFATLRALVTGLALVLSVVTPAGSQDLGKGAAAYQRGDYSTALREFGLLAATGDAEAQNAIGFMYHRGHGVPQDYAEAGTWFRKAADQGLAKAQYNLATLYAKGEGMPQDLAEAAKWYRKAAEQGHAGAKTKLQAVNEEQARGASTSPGDRAFYVQLGSLRSKAVADAEAGRLTRAYHSVLGALKVVTVQADLGESGVFHRLWAGPLPDRAAAEAICRALSGPEQGCVVIKS